MQKILLIILISVISTTGHGQGKDEMNEKYGNTLNIGAGIGYYGYAHNPLPVVLINYEIGVADYFTVAPFAGLYSYRNNEYGFNTNPNGYSYRETVAPLGAKASYYFDKLLRAGRKWDFYAAASVSYMLRNVAWDTDYYGSRSVYKSSRAVYADIHIGTEYHITANAGLFVDISTGVSSGGLAIHF